MIQLDAMAGLGEGVVTSPIVGVVTRSQEWDSYTVTVPESSVGDSEGWSTYTSGGDGTGTLSLAVTRDADTITGAAGYTVVDENTVSLDPFSLTVGSNLYLFEGVTLTWDGIYYRGELLSSDSTEYSSILFMLVLSHLPDADADGIPDLSDLDIASSSNPWAAVPLDLPTRTKQVGLGWIWDDPYPYLWSYAFNRWVFVWEGSTLGNLYLYVYDAPTEEWIWANDSWNGWYYSYNRADWFDATP
jgi:hypothetical protein